MPVIEGELDGKIVAIASAGWAATAARRAAGILLDGHRPRWLISAGFAGALNPDPEPQRPGLARGSDRSRRPPIPGQPAGLARRRGPPRPPGRLLTVNRLDPRLGRETGAAPDRRGRPGRHGNLGRRRPLRREARPVPVGPDRQRRCAHRPASRGRHAHDQVGRAIASVRHCGRSGIGRRASRTSGRSTSTALEAADRLARFIERCLGELPA